MSGWSNLFTGANVKSAGIFGRPVCEIGRMRKRTGSKVAVYAMYMKYMGFFGEKAHRGCGMGGASNEAFADGLFMSGKTVEEEHPMAKEARMRVRQIPLIFLGGGATGECA